MGERDRKRGRRHNFLFADLEWWKRGHELRKTRVEWECGKKLAKDQDEKEGLWGKSLLGRKVSLLCAIE